MTKGRDTTYEERIALVHECIPECLSDGKGVQAAYLVKRAGTEP